MAPVKQTWNWKVSRNTPYLRGHGSTGAVAEVPHKEDDSIFILIAYFSVRQVRTLSRQNSWRHVLDVVPCTLAMALAVEGLTLLLLLFPLLLLFLQRRLPFLRPRESDSLSGHCWTCLCAVPHKGGWPPSSLFQWLPGRPMSMRWHRAKLCMAMTRELRAEALMALGGFCSSSSSASSWHMLSSSAITGRGPAAVPYKDGLLSTSLLWLFFLPDIHPGPQSVQLQRALFL